MVVSEIDGQFQRFLSVLLWSYLCNCCRGLLPANAALPSSHHRHSSDKMHCVLCHLFGSKFFCVIKCHKLIYHNVCQSDLEGGRSGMGVFVCVELFFPFLTAGAPCCLCLICK